MESRAESHSVVGPSPRMTELMTFVRKIPSSEVSEATPILIQGESGTGKDLIAKVIHCECSRVKRACLAIHCSTILERRLDVELFGHERGPCKSAKPMKKDLFELATGGHFSSMKSLHFHHCGRGVVFQEPASAQTQQPP
jgi:transcriptional regulator with GAF, ATPase, and Fis domain